jgi:hypothetical protein
LPAEAGFLYSITLDKSTNTKGNWKD